MDIFNQLNADPTRHFTILESSENNSYPLRSTDTESVASSEDSTTPLLLDSYAAPLIYNTKTRKAAPRSRHRFLPRQFSFGQTPDRQDQTAEEARTLFSAPHESLMCHSDGGNEGSGYEEEWIFPSPSGGNPILKPQTTPPPKITLSTSSPSEDWCESLPAPLQFDYFTSHGAPSTDPQILHDPLYYHPSSPTASIPALTKRWQSLGDEARSLNDEIQHLETRNSSTSTLPIPDPEPSPPPTPTPSSPPSPGDSYLPTPPDSSVPELPQAAIDLLTSLPPILLRSKEVDERIAELKKERDELRACWREIQKIHQLREEQRERIDLMEAKLAENIRAARDEKKGF